MTQSVRVTKRHVLFEIMLKKESTCKESSLRDYAVTFLLFPYWRRTNTACCLSKCTGWTI